MNRSRFRLLATAWAVSVSVSGAVLAMPPSPAPTGAPQRHPMMQMDSNHDGAIDRAEVAGHPGLAAKFDALDKNRDGRLDPSERPQGKGQRGRPGHRGKMMAHVVRLDTDGDGRISRTEAAAQPQVAARFDQVDGNRDGYLVRSEMMASAERRRGEAQARHAQRFDTRFSAADLNHDGKLSRVEVAAAMPHQAKAFAFLDEDRDGFLTRADLQRKPRR